MGTGVTLAVKLNSADFQRGGFSEQESMAVIERLEAEGVDLLEVSGGTYEAAVMFDERAPKSESTRKREAFFLDYAERVRERTKMPLMVTGGFRTRAGMEDALAGGAVDLVGLARPLAVEPDLSARLLSGEADRALPVRLATGWKKLDAIVQGGWHQAQIERMARGKAPHPGLSRFLAVLKYFQVRRWRSPKKLTVQTAG